MKRCRITIAVVVLAVAAGGPPIASAVTLEGSGYYTWGISPNDVSIPDGYIITDAVVTLYGLTSASESLADTLVVYLLDNPPVGFHGNSDIAGVDHFAPHGCRLKPDYADRTKGYETVSFRLGAIDYPRSWVWQVYERPFSFELADAQAVAFSSAILELIDYIGNGTPFGIGLDPAGTSDFTLGGLSLTLTIQSFQGPPHKTELKLTFANPNSPPILRGPGACVVYEGAPLHLVFSAGDPDGDIVHLSAGMLPSGATFDDGVLSWKPPYDTTSTGSAVPFAVTVRAADGVLWTSRTFVIWVFNTNRPPVLVGLTPLSGEGETLLSYRVQAIDPDGDPMTCTVTQLPPGAVFDPQTWTVLWDTTAVTGGAGDITVAVSDGSLSSTRTFSMSSTVGDRATTGPRR
jgi:hypothetical protein